MIENNTKTTGGLEAQEPTRKPSIEAGEGWILVAEILFAILVAGLLIAFMFGAADAPGSPGF